MSETIQPLVSIITPVFNSEAFLEDTLLSVKNQNYKNWEHIIIDDCSSDRSIEIIAKFQESDSRIKLIRLIKNSGSGVARNEGIKIAHGQYIAFIDSDDVWLPMKLEKQIEFMIINKILLSYTSYGYIDEVGRRIKSTYRVSNRPLGYKDLLKKTDIGCLTGMYNAEVLGKFYMSEHRRKQDYALWLSILKTGVKAYGMEEVFASYRLRRNSATSNKFKLIFLHVRFLQETQNFNLLNAIYYTLLWSYNGIKKTYVK